MEKEKNIDKTKKYEYKVICTFSKDVSTIQEVMEKIIFNRKFGKLSKYIKK